MGKNQVELARRKKVALDAIKSSLGTEAGEFAATLFASHHIDELDPSYWEEHLGTDKPELAQVLGLLVCLCAHPNEDEGEVSDMFDFGLPGSISDYVLCVKFTGRGEIEYICMEN